MRYYFLIGLIFNWIQPAIAGPTPVIPNANQIDSHVRAAMTATHAQGIAVAVIDGGEITFVRSWGIRNREGLPLHTDTVMYGASLTKAVFAYTIMQLVEEKILDLDASIATYLPKPLPEYPDEDKYAPWSTLAGDERWRKLTPRMLLTHSSGFANFAFLEPDGKLRFHFDPGTRYAYSGEGFILLQFVLERGLGLDVGVEMQQRVFDRFKMTNTSMIWQPRFARNLADGWAENGETEPHDERSKARAAGSMDTTIADFAKFSAGFIKKQNISAASFESMVGAQLPIKTASQFPSLQPEVPPDQQHKMLAAGLGFISFTGPQGRGFFRGGHNETTGNAWVCLERGQRCVVILSNDVRAEPAFPGIVSFILGDTGLPWSWVFGVPANPISN